MNFENIIEQQKYIISNLSDSAEAVSEQLVELIRSVNNYNATVEAYREAHKEASTLFSSEYLEQQLGFEQKKYIDAQFSKKFENAISDIQGTVTESYDDAS